jgi:uncharacterized protein YjdB
MRSPSTTLLSMFAVLLILSTACNTQRLASVEEVPVASITVSPPTLGITVGGRVAVLAIVLGTNGNPLSGKSVTWSSSNPAIANVAQTGETSGEVLAVALGTASVTAMSGGKSSSIAVTVTQEPAVSIDTIVIAPSSASVDAGQTVQLTAVAKDASGNILTGRAISWSSSNTSIATVSNSGLVTGVAPGIAGITAASEGQQTTATITVMAPPATPVATVDVTPATVTVGAGQTAQLTATPKSATGAPLTGRSITWISSNLAVATVSSTGLVTGVSAGTATITATSEGKSGQAAVTVTAAPPVPVATVSVTPATASVVIGQTVQLAATPKDANGNTLSGRVVTWSSSNAAVATVSATGLVTGVSAGAATITAMSEGKTGTASITVTSPPPPPPPAVASVSVTPATASVVAGQTVQLTATPRDASGNALTGRVVTWASSNTAVATVSSSGLVSGVTAGSATITATSEGQSGQAAVTVTAPPPVPVATVTVAPATASVAPGQTVQLTATTRDANGNTLTGRVVTWASSNTAVATVSSSGLVTGVIAGSVTITATSEGRSGTATVTVTATVTNPGTVTNLAVASATANAVTLSFTEVPNGAGAPASYEVRYATAPLSWGSASAVAQGTCAVPLAGTAIGATRTCTVQGLAASTNYQFQLVAFRGTLNVDAVFGALSNVASGTTTASTAPVATVTVTPASVSLGVGATQQLTATLRDANGNTLTGRVVTWSSANAGLATVSASGLITGIAVGSTTITATSEGRSGTASVTVSGAPAAGECATPQAGWIWCDDFEQDRLSRYFEYVNNGGNFARAVGVGFGGSTGMRARYANVGQTQVTVGALHLAFGRTPQSYFRPADAGTANYRDVYWRIYLKHQAGWLGGGADKLSRATIFASSSSWAQAMIAHVWSGEAPGPDQNYLVIDPASGTDASGNLRTTGYNDWNNMRWLGGLRGPTPLFDASHVGQWYCIEAHVKLNDAGQSNGLFELWINGTLEARRTALNWVGAYNAYGINAIFFENHWDAGPPQVQERYMDNIIVSTQPIGCVGSAP